MKLDNGKHIGGRQQQKPGHDSPGLVWIQGEPYAAHTCNGQQRPIHVAPGPGATNHFMVLLSPFDTGGGPSQPPSQDQRPPPPPSAAPAPAGPHTQTHLTELPMVNVGWHNTTPNYNSYQHPQQQQQQQQEPVNTQLMSDPPSWTPMSQSHTIPAFPRHYDHSSNGNSRNVPTSPRTPAQPSTVVQPLVPTQPPMVEHDSVARFRLEAMETAIHVVKQCIYEGAPKPPKGYVPSHFHVKRESKSHANIDENDQNSGIQSRLGATDNDHFSRYEIRSPLPQQYRATPRPLSTPNNRSKVAAPMSYSSPTRGGVSTPYMARPTPSSPIPPSPSPRDYVAAQQQSLASPAPSTSSPFLIDSSLPPPPPPPPSQLQKQKKGKKSLWPSSPDMLTPPTPPISPYFAKSQFHASSRIPGESPPSKRSASDLMVFSSSSAATSSSASEKIKKQERGMGIAPGSLSRMPIPKMAGGNNENGKGKGKGKEEQQHQQKKYETRARTDSSGRPGDGDDVNFAKLEAMMEEFDLGQGNIY